ncbi:hypothetical protein [Sphingobacterium sp.]|uniref:hypothetical protein n=1 Tax=Sphingobacterium sp. TaxID=341027 RepID=UPI0028A937F7|nr:hypothetical protein [Sphingobacterium sp.]
MINSIKGGIAEDKRGHIRFVNDFDMTFVKRFYIIKNADTELIRGWRGHKIEQRWFYVLFGQFSVNLVQVDNWDLPSKDLAVRNEILKSSDMKILNVSPGYATTFQALAPNSELLVFSDYTLEHALIDDYTWPLEYFINLNI